eukprot:PITA_19045
MSTIRLVLAVAAQFNWKVYQMDVKSAFLNGDLQEEVNMTQPPGFKVAGQEQKVCRLVKALYDSDWANSVDNRKSTAGYVFNLGSGVVTWTSKKQQVVAFSSTEAEYRGAIKASCEAVCLRRMLADMHVFQTSPTPLFCDNQGVLKLAKNPVFHERTKHVETHCHYIRQLVEDGSVQL